MSTAGRAFLCVRSNSSKRARPRSAADDSKARKPNSAAKKAPIAIDVESDHPLPSMSPRGEDEDDSDKEADGSEMSLARVRSHERVSTVSSRVLKQTGMSLLERMHK